MVRGIRLVIYAGRSLDYCGSTPRQSSYTNREIPILQLIFIFISQYSLFCHLTVIMVSEKMAKFAVFICTLPFVVYTEKSM